ncbi:MAG: MarR family winged helix-turn-helix transcriptional regulator [Chloroflexota bacterium]
MQVFGNIDWNGTRLTELAASAGMTRPSMSELVDELEQAGYLERRPDPTDRRAKLIVLTRAGRRLIVQVLRWVRDLERGYAEDVGPERFEALAETLQALLDARAAGRPGPPRETNGTLTTS